MSRYQTKIAAICESKALDGIEARIIEAWMRLEHRTLDHLTREQFRREVLICFQLARAASQKENEDLARSYGL